MKDRKKELSHLRKLESEVVTLVRYLETRLSDEPADLARIGAARGRVRKTLIDLMLMRKHKII